MGAIQAQDYNMSKWALGIRLPGSTQKSIEAALDKGEIIRTHLLRPTWHIVSAENIYWMLELTAPRIKASMKSRHKQLELTKEVITKCLNIIEDNLTRKINLTREELAGELEKSNISTKKDNRLSHILLLAELEGLICNGAAKGKKNTYALLKERVPSVKRLGREEALAKLASTYFASHGPATLQDFTWWSGLTITDAKLAMEMIKSDFHSEKTGTQTFLFDNNFSINEKYWESAYLLPAFDEFIISYKDRSIIVSSEEQNRIISRNGMFWPVLLMNGQAVGTWKKVNNSGNVIVEISYFPGNTLCSNKNIETLIEKEIEIYINFLGTKTK